MRKPSFPPGDSRNREGFDLTDDQALLVCLTCDARYAERVSECVTCGSTFLVKAKMLRADISHARPLGGWEITLGRTPVTILRNDFELNERVYRIETTRRFVEITLAVDDSVIGRATRRYADTDLDIEANGRTYRLEQRTAAEFSLVLDEKVVGRIYGAPAPLFNFKTIIDLPEDIPLEIRIFMYWLAMATRQRQSAG